MADPLDSQNIARHAFGVGRRGYEQQEVRAFLHEVSALVERLQREAQELRQRAERAEARLGVSGEPDDSMLLEVLGEETTRVLTSAREAAAEIRTKAEAAAERIIGDATSESAETKADAIREADRRLAEATAESETLLADARSELERRSAEAEEAAARIREAAAADAQALRDEGQRDLEQIREGAEAEVETARERGREMVAEAQAVRERVLRDLAVRRKKARQQVEKLNAGRERLLEAYDVVRRTVDEATNELTTSLSDARLAADAAARRIAEEPDPTLEQLDEEVSTAALIDLPITDLDEHDDEVEAPGPFSGEVPAVVVEEPAPPPAEPTDAPDTAAPPVDLEERRGRKGRRRKETFEGLPPAAFSKVEQPEGEGVRILADAAPAPEGPGADEEPEAAAPDDPAADPPAADDVFARLRAEQEAAGEPGEAEPHAEDEPPSEPEDGVGAEPSAFTERDEALAPIDKELARRLKRALADEQNEVLDRLRRVKPKGVDDVLPDADEHAGRWSEVVATPLVDAATAGSGWAGGSAAAVDDLAAELARSLTAPLRERIDRSFVASDGNLDDVADRVRALYREWKGQRLAETSRHYVAAAYARGAYDGLPEGASVHWILDPLGGPCPDCDDNGLGGVLTKGAEFPTGHRCAPAHPGCRCLVVAADR
jgi:cell division septum initiation protein DivIVA